MAVAHSRTHRTPTHSESKAWENTEISYPLYRRKLRLARKPTTSLKNSDCFVDLVRRFQEQFPDQSHQQYKAERSKQGTMLWGLNC